MTNNPNWNYINVSVHEKKAKTEKLFSLTQKYILLKSINKDKSFDLFILFELVFDLGFTVYQCSRIKIKNIFFNQEIIEIKYKGKRKIRTIGYELTNILEKYIKKNGLNTENYLLYNDFVETKIMNRNKYLYLQLSKLILNCEELNNNTKDKLLDQMTKERIVSNKILFEVNHPETLNNFHKNEINDLKNNNENLELSDKNEFVYFNGVEDYNDNISIIDKKSYESFMLINQDLIIPRIEDNSELLFYSKEKNNEYIQKKFNLLYQEINLENITKKNTLLEKLKSLNIKFVDNPIKELSFIGLNTFVNKICSPLSLSEDNLEKYKELKYYTRMGFYAGLMLSNIEENILVIEATQDINENTLLFEIGGEVVREDYLIKYKKDLFSKTFCYFRYCEGAENSKFFILLRDYGNIAFFYKIQKNLLLTLKLKIS